MRVFILIIIVIGLTVSLFPRETIVQKWSSYYNVDYTLIESMISQESGGQGHVISPAGAMGIMQVTRYAFEECGIDIDEVDPFDPDNNIMCGVRYFAVTCGGMADVRKALACYQAGPSTLGLEYSAYTDTTKYYIDKVLSIWNNR